MTETTVHKSNSRKAKSSHPSRPLKFWQDHSQDQQVHIEIVPLIDVIFCILTFFILGAVGLSRQNAISMDLPKASTGAPQMRDMLVVSLDDGGQVYLEKQLVTQNQLFDGLKNYHQFNPGGLMVLHASRNSVYNQVVQVLDVMRQVGGDRVALATLPGEAAAPDNWSSSPSNFSPLPPATGLTGGYRNPASQSFPGNANQGLGNYPSPSNPSNTITPNVPAAPGTTPEN